MNYKKKAAVTVDFMVTLIILILGFVILLIFLYNTYWNQSVDRETCHESVIFRATLPGVVQQSIPLKCKTNKICISTKSKGECTDFAGVSGVTTLKVRSGNNGIADIQKFYANEIVDCWSMLGQGKVSLFYSFAERYGVGNIVPSCVICSRISFDKDSLKDSSVDLSKINIQEYMLTHLMEGKNLTYYQYLAGENGLFDLGDKKLNVNPLTEGDNTLDNSGGEIDSSMINPVNQATSSDLFAPDSVLFMQISSPDHAKALKNSLMDIGLTWGSGTLLAPQIMTKATAGVAKSWYFWAAVAIAGIYQQGSVAWNRAISARYCGDMTVGGEGRAGCSVVRVVNYNPSEISQYCTNIEGIP